MQTLTIQPGEILPSSGYIAARRHVGLVPVGEYVEYDNAPIVLADGFALFVPVGQTHGDTAGSYFYVRRSHLASLERQRVLYSRMADKSPAVRVEGHFVAV